MLRFVLQISKSSTGNYQTLSLLFTCEGSGTWGVQWGLKVNAQVSHKPLHMHKDVSGTFILRPVVSGTFILRPVVSGTFILRPVVIRIQSLWCLLFSAIFGERQEVSVLCLTECTKRWWSWEQRSEQIHTLAPPAGHRSHPNDSIPLSLPNFLQMRFRRTGKATECRVQGLLAGHATTSAARSHYHCL